MICPNCGFSSPDGTMFCGKCGTRLQNVPVPQNQFQISNPYYNQGAAQQQYGQAAQQRPAAQYQQSAYNQYAAPAQPYQPVATVNPNQRTMVYPNSPGVVSPYSVVPPIRSVVAPPQTKSVYGQNTSGSQYTAVSATAYAQSMSAMDDIPDDTEKNGGTIFLAICIILLCGILLYMSGVFDFLKADVDADPTLDPDYTYTEPIDKAPTNPSVTPGVSDASGSDVGQDTPAPVGVGFPASFSDGDKAELNSFLSSFTEVGFQSFNQSPTIDELLHFAVTGLGMNSNVYSTLSSPYTVKGVDYNYAVPANEVNDRIMRYFGVDSSAYANQFDSGNGWFFYQNQFYFPKIETSKGFAIATGYTEDGTVTFNVYEPVGSDVDTHSLTVEKAQAAGYKVIGTGTAKVGKADYNGRSVYHLVEYSVN